MRVFDGLLHVHYGQAYVMSGEDGDTGQMPACFKGQSNGLLGAAEPGWLFLVTGLHTGFVRLTVEVAEDDPPLDDRWEECVEASFSPGVTDVRLLEWGGELVCRLPLPSAEYRVRYAARGMDAGHAADTVIEGENPVDSYRLWFWPAASAPDRVIKQTSDTASTGTTGRKDFDSVPPTRPRTSLKRLGPSHYQRISRPPRRVSPR